MQPLHAMMHAHLCSHERFLRCLLKSNVRWCSSRAQGNKVCEICRQPYKGAYKDPPSKAASAPLSSAASMRGATLVPQGLLQLSMSQISGVCLAYVLRAVSTCCHACLLTQRQIFIAGVHSPVCAQFADYAVTILLPSGVSAF